MNLPLIRVGSGFDVHRFAQNRPLFLGGVSIPHELGLAGHSDADVLIHALIDALLGASSLGDIGILFPDSDASYKNIDSTILLARVVERLRESSFEIINCDMTVICERPKLAPHREAIQRRLAGILGLDPGRISVKATTTEGLGYTGRGEGIAAQAVCLVAKSSL